MRHPEVTVRLAGEDGNAFSILGRVAAELRRECGTDEAARYIEEAAAGDYDHLLRTTMQWVDVV